VRHRGERVETRRLIESFAIVVPSDEAPLNILSGGNQQKVVLARWLRRRPRVLVLDDPTRGVDIAARNDIHALLRNAVDAGASALVASSDLAELAFVADRVLILAEGRIEAELHGPELHTESLSRLVGGDAARAA
jgi:ribose transport system ATP-binding protein